MDRRTFLGACTTVAAAGLLQACSSDRPTSTSSGRALATTTATSPPDGDILTGSFRSRHRGGAQTRWLITYPPGHKDGDPLPVLITLHGTGSGEDTPWVLRWQETSRRLHEEGRTPYACVGVTGGDTWWHPRASGQDSAAMITDELFPILRGRRLRLDRPAFYGYSMGGVGAVWLAAQRGAAATSSVVLASTPFLHSWDEIPGSYDSASDFQQHGIRALWPRLAGIPVRADVGDQDPFRPSNQEFLPGARPRAELHVSPGGHDRDFWGSVALDELRFVAEHL